MTNPPASPGSIGEFPILGELGRGGMGVVYLGHDPRLDRPLAIKVLPDGVARDGDRLARLRHEARLIASLSHPNIATIYGLVEPEDGPTALVLEFIDGPSLAMRISAGALSLDATLRVGVQIADALAAAHDRGIVHLDLKPGNVMMTSRDLVKLLDFGIARPAAGGTEHQAGAVRQSGPGSAAALDATTIDGAAPGTPGTPGYMSPEQIMGGGVDMRTDLFALGCVLFECLAGQRPFARGEPGELLTRTLLAEPDWALLPADTPVRMRTLLEGCLRKDPEERPRTASEVSTSLRTILDDIRRGEERTGAAPLPAIPASNVPAALTSFVGREKEVNQLRILAANARLLTLTGPGGCGKTRLALELATPLREKFPDGIWLIDLAPVSDPSRVVRSVAAVAGVKEEPGGSIEQALMAHFREQRALLLFDNCEHLRESVGTVVRDLLGAAPGVAVLATSRERLGIPGEQEYPVPSLARSESVRLFVERARLVRPAWSPDDGETRQVAEICRRLDGIPLAIELAAARMRLFAVDQILAKLTDRFRFLAHTEKGAIPRHQTLRAALDWSYDLLTSDERRHLRGLSVFTGGWTLEAATAVCGEGKDEFAVLNLTTHLVDRSLVTVDRAARGEARFSLLETVRQYAREEMAKEDDAAALRNRHLDYYVALAAQAAHNFQGPSQAAWYRRLESEHENVLAALEWTYNGDGEPAKGMRLVAAIWPFWEARGHLALGRVQADRVLERGHNGEPSILLARTLGAAGSLAWNASDYHAAWSRHAESLAIFRQVDDRRGIARALGSLGLVASEMEDHEAARSLYQDCLEQFRELGDRLNIARTLGNLALVVRDQGDSAAARRLQEERLGICRELGSLRMEAITLTNLAVISIRTGEFARARGELIEGIEIIAGLEDHLSFIAALETASDLFAELGDDAVAIRMRASAVSLREEFGMPGSPAVQGDLGRFREALLQRVGEEAFHAGWTEGSGMSLPDATIRVRECLSQAGPGRC